MTISFLDRCFLFLSFLFLVEYQDDDEYIPKNTSLVVKRVPAKTAANSLIARLRGGLTGGHASGGRGAIAPGATANGASDGAIFMPVKAEDAFVETTVRDVAHDVNQLCSYRCYCIVLCSCHSRLLCVDNGSQFCRFLFLVVMFLLHLCQILCPLISSCHVSTLCLRQLIQFHPSDSNLFSYSHHPHLSPTLLPPSILPFQATKFSSDVTQGQGANQTDPSSSIQHDPQPHQLASSEILTEEEQQALLMLGSTGGRQTGASSSSTYPPRWGTHSAGTDGVPGENIKGMSRAMGGGGRGGGGRGGGSESYGASSTSAYGSNYVCKRCGRPGHFVTNCPSKRMYDILIAMSNIISLLYLLAPLLCDVI